TVVDAGSQFSSSHFLRNCLFKIRLHGSTRELPRNLTSKKTCHGSRPSATLINWPPTLAAASSRNRYRSSSSISVSANRRMRLSVPCFSATRLAAAQEPTPPLNITTCCIYSTLPAVRLSRRINLLQRQSTLHVGLPDSPRLDVLPHPGPPHFPEAVKVAQGVVHKPGQDVVALGPH